MRSWFLPIMKVSILDNTRCYNLHSDSAAVRYGLASSGVLQKSFIGIRSLLREAEALLALAYPSALVDMLLWTNPLHSQSLPCPGISKQQQQQHGEVYDAGLCSSLHAE